MPDIEPKVKYLNINKKDFKVVADYLLERKKMKKIKYPRIKFMRDSNGKLTSSVQVLVELDEKNETLDWYSLKQIKTILTNQKREEK